MRFSQFCKLMTLSTALLLAATAFAGSNPHKGSMTLGDAVQVNGKQLPAGEYKVVWDGDGPNVNVRFLRDGKEVASAPATVSSLDQIAKQDAAELHSTGETKQITAVRFAGKKIQLDISSSASEAKANSSSPVNK